MKKNLNEYFLYKESRTKIFRIMKLTMLFILIGLVHASANSYSQNAKISLDLKNAELKEVIAEIQKQTEFIFFYSPEDVETVKNLNVKVENAQLQDILDDCFDGTEIGYEIKHKAIVLKKVQKRKQFSATPENENSQLQKKSIRGKITDEKGIPLPGVSIIVKGTTIGVTSDIDGNYLLDIPANAEILVFSFIGMKTQEVTIGTNENINVKLEEETIGVEEIVVTALGIKRQEKALGYAVQKVNGETLATVKGVDIQTSLSGKVAGLLVKNTTEFGKESEILIRGEEPLLVIDGVPYGNMKLRDVPSDDIQGINMLKGATASALYGSRGASGVVMITTKKGAKSKGVTVTVNSGTMVNAGFLAIPEMQSTFGREVKANSYTEFDAEYEYYRNGQGSWGPALEGQTIVQWDPVSKSMQPMPFLPVGKDNFKNFLESGHILNNNISIVQQGERGSIRASATWVNNKGQYPNSEFNKYTYSLGGDIKLDKFKLSSSMAYNKQKSPNLGFNGFTSYDPMFTMLVFSSPDWDVRQYKDYWVVEYEKQNSSYTGKCNNPYFDRYERLHTLDKDVFNANVSMDYEIKPWLTATFRTGLDMTTDRQEIRLSKDNFVSTGSGRVLEEGGSQIWGESKKGSYNIGMARRYSINSDMLLSGQHKFDDWSVEGFVGASVFYKHYEGIEAKTNKGLTIPGYYSLLNSEEDPKVKSLIKKKQVNSLYGRLGFSWKNLIFIDGTLRNDWSSTLPESTRSYLYPSLSGSFVVSEILPATDWLSFWKFRGSWSSSKKEADIYEVNTVYTITPNDWDGLTSAGYPTIVRGSDLESELLETFEVGTNVNVLNNRVSLDVAYYQNKRSNEIKDATVSKASGFDKRKINSETEKTMKGVELILNTTPVKKNDWQWNVMFNWSKYARYYTKLDPTEDDQLWIREDMRTDHLVGKDFLRDQDGNIIHGSDGNPIKSSYKSVLGYADPDWIWGANSTLTYKNFSFSLAVDGRVGGMTRSYTNSYMYRTGNHPNSVNDARYKDVMEGGKNYIGEGVKVVSGTATYDTYGRILTDDRVFAVNDNPTTYKEYVNNLYSNIAWGAAPTSYDVKETTFFKIREISLTYRIPDNVCSKFGAKGASVSAIGQNVFMWAKEFKYSDPDEGSENLSDPSIRYLGVNVKLTF